MTEKVRGHLFSLISIMCNMLKTTAKKTIEPCSSKPCCRAGKTSGSSRRANRLKWVIFHTVRVDPENFLFNTSEVFFTNKVCVKFIIQKLYYYNSIPVWIKFFMRSHALGVHFGNFQSFDPFFCSCFFKYDPSDALEPDFNGFISKWVKLAPLRILLEGLNNYCEENEYRWTLKGVY